MNTFIAILTVMASPVNVEANTAVNLVPETTIQFVNSTEKKVAADCERVRKALTSSGKIAFCAVGDELSTASLDE